VSAYFNLALRGIDEDGEFDLPSCLLAMIKSCKYYPSPTFISSTYGALDLALSNILYRICTKPENTTMIDVLQLFFGLDMNEAATYQAGQTTTIDNRRMVSAADRRMDRIREALSRTGGIFLAGSDGAGPSSRAGNQ
jgi:hypothetical protein